MRLEDTHDICIGALARGISQTLSLRSIHNTVVTPKPPKITT